MDISTGCVAGCRGVGEMGVFVAIILSPPCGAPRRHQKANIEYLRRVKEGGERDNEAGRPSSDNRSAKNGGGGRGGRKLRRATLDILIYR
jgi:hypothetical protein